ncbi:hypothetical protein [Bacteriovorax sp. Seq25_V]|uniref:hypothetical protein n=1 Tax=Bacteriovorax sp. Seq25_V TaxID=1201288 RepID=UPI00038A032A|nr:hypothetical protein [Bacteriovorax sp. Seq25_V]EQC43441.1 hypothetical protein M900_0226 [Bacteriovorax sp. Seq25_V]
MNSTEKVTCFKCLKPLDLEPGTIIHRSEECPHCLSSLHCCKMCNFYDQKSYNECREPSADRIVEKEANNFCDYFILKGGGDNGSSKDDLLAQANSLFKF